MKIFFEDRFIELLDGKPVNTHPGERTVEFRKSKAFETILDDFLEARDPANLVCWSGKGGDGWKKHFFSFFRWMEAAGGVVRNEKKEVLFIHRLGRWDLPKGKLVHHETPEAAAVREVKEETGLTKVTVTKPLPETYHMYRRKGKTILKRTSWFEMKAEGRQKLVPQAEEDISEVAWINREKRSIVLGNTYASIRELLIPYFAAGV
jgi:8-oxo-dGTP pyrophosphatase MutT (NUDIX family)